MVSLPRWKQVLCSFAAVLLVAGVGMKGVLLVRDGLLAPSSGSSTRLLNPAPGTKWPGPGPGAADAPGVESSPRTKSPDSDPGGEKPPDAAEAIPGSPGEPGGRPRSALVEPAGASKTRTSIDQNAPASAPATQPTAGSADSVPGGDFLEEWSPTFLKGGLGFFVAFLIGFALQAFARLFALFLGLFCLGVLGLSSLGWITIEWQIAQQQFITLPTVLSQQFSGLQSFLQGALPSLGMAGLGLFAGLKKK